MFEEPINTKLPPLTERNIRLMFIHHKLRWLFTMSTAIPAILILFIFHGTVAHLPGFVIIGGMAFLSCGAYYVAGYIFPMSRFHGTAAVEHVKRELRMQLAKEKYLQKMSKSNLRNRGHGY